MERYSAIRRNEVTVPVVTWLSLKTYLATATGVRYRRMRRALEKDAGVNTLNCWFKDGPSGNVTLMFSHNTYSVSEARSEGYR